jgi:cholesterol transport system auxiliary component
MYRRTFLTLSAAGLTTVLAACMGARPPITYDLQPTRRTGPVQRRTSRTIVVTEPQVIQTYDTERVVVRDGGGVLSYLPEAQWSDRLPRLIQTRLLQSFEDSQFPNIGRPTDQLQAEVALAMDVRAFELDVSTGNAVVTMSARMIDDVNRRIISNRSFTGSVPLTSLNAAPAIAALDGALAQVIDQMMVWAAQNA